MLDDYGLKDKEGQVARVGFTEKQHHDRYLD